MAALAAFSPLSARAQEVPPQAAVSDRDQARALADEGLVLYEQDRYTAALVAFQEAERKFHAPTLLLMIARTQVRLGLLDEAKETYQQIVDEQLANYAPPQFFEAQEAARRGLEELTAALPAEEDPAEPPALTPTPIAPVIEKSTPVAPPAQEPVSSPGVPGPALVAFGVAGLGLGIGTVTAAITLSKVNQVEATCTSDNRNCDPDLKPVYYSAQTLSTVSIVSFAIAGVGTAAGVTLLLLQPRERDQKQVSLVLAPSWVGVRGRL